MNNPAPYHDDSSRNGWVPDLTLPTIIVGIWAFFTIFYWMAVVDCTDYYHFNDVGDCTLVDVVKSQWEWIKDLANRIV